MAYILVRTLPDGEERQHSPAPTLRQVETAAAYVLMDNARVLRNAARTFARRLVEQPVGAQVRHDASGYAFRVEVTR